MTEEQAKEITNQLCYLNLLIATLIKVQMVNITTVNTDDINDLEILSRTVNAIIDKI